MSEKPRHPEKVNKPINPIKKKPDWIRSKILNSRVFFETKKVVNQNNLVTVCQEANCPNITGYYAQKKNLEIRPKWLESNLCDLLKV